MTLIRKHWNLGYDQHKIQYKVHANWMIWSDPADLRRRTLCSLVTTVRILPVRTAGAHPRFFPGSKVKRSDSRYHTDCAVPYIRQRRAEDRLQSKRAAF
jgi:hypothetical protein